MGAGCCGGDSGTGYNSKEDAPPVYGATRSYSPGSPPGRESRYDPMRHFKDPLGHLHSLYRKPQHHGPYERPEDGHANARLAQAAERLASPEAKYGAGMARTLYWNVSGI